MDARAGCSLSRPHSLDLACGIGHIAFLLTEKQPDLLMDFNRIRWSALDVKLLNYAQNAKLYSIFTDHPKFWDGRDGT